MCPGRPGWRYKFGVINVQMLFKSMSLDEEFTKEGNTNGEEKRSKD